MTKNDIFYAFGIIFVVAIVGFFLNNRQDNLAGRAVYMADGSLPTETISCIFEGNDNTCYVHFEGSLYSCAGKECSISIKGINGKSALVTSTCGEEFSAKLDGQDEKFMFSC